MRLLLTIVVLSIAIALAGCGGGGFASPSASATPPVTTANVAPSTSRTSGPQTSWMVVTLPNPRVTPSWQKYAPADCKGDVSGCGEDHRFWEEWDFSAFQSAIDASFADIHNKGQYQGVMVLMPLADSPTFWNNINVMFNAANSHGLQFQAVLFPKNKYGAEQCYLYADNAPGECAVAPGTSTAVAYQQLLKQMNYIENLGGGCASGQSNRPIAIWYGWPVLPGYDALNKFWSSLPTQGCNLRASYVTWLDTMYSAAPEVAELQKYVTGTLHQDYHVNTELYSDQQIQGSYQLYAPSQTVITGFADANDTKGWAQGMCGKWKTAGQPTALGVWNYSDRDIAPVEDYAAIINGSMAAAGTVCGGGTS